MENRFKLKLTSIFHKASLGTCRSRTASDVIEKAVFLPQNPTNVSDPPPQPFPTNICRPKHSDDRKNPQPTNQRALISRCNTDVLLPRRGKLAERRSPFLKAKVFADDDNALFFMNSNLFYDVHENRSFRKKKNMRASNVTKIKNTKKSDLSSCLDSSNNHYYNGWWSSSEDETDTLFSSNTHTSDSSNSRRRRRRSSSQGNQKKETDSEMGLMPMQGKVKDSFAVVKKSSDPYSDFRTSMVEMIVEKQIFSGKDLENLLQCFLNLNSPHHHRIIVEVFIEIWEALFSNLGT